MTLTILDSLYIVLIVFTSVIWTLLIINLLKLRKILTSVEKVTDYVDKVNNVIETYNKIPEMVIEKVKSIIFGNKKD